MYKTCALPGPDLLRVIPGVLCRGLEGLGKLGGSSGLIFLLAPVLSRRYALGTRVYVPQTRRDAQRSSDGAEAAPKKKPPQGNFLGKAVSQSREP